MVKSMNIHFKEVTSERQVIPHDQAVTSMVSMVQHWKEIHTCNLSLSYNKIIIALCFARHEVLLNSQLNHIVLCFNPIEFYCSNILGIHIRRIELMYLYTTSPLP